MRSKEKIATGLMICAIVLLLTNIFLQGGGNENKWIRIAGWSAFAIALVYRYKLKKDNKSRDNGA